MNKILWIWLMFVAAFLASGCVPESANETKPAPVEINVVEAEETEKSLIEHFRYLDENIEYMTIDEATEYFYMLEELSIKKQFYYVEIVSLDKKMKESLMACYDETTGAFDFGLYDGTSGMIIEEIYQNGYKLIPYSGTIYPVTDYSHFKNYIEYMDEETGSYIRIKSMESDGYHGIKATDKMSLTELTKRLVMAEEHLRKFNSSRTYPIVLEMYKTYMYYFMPNEFSRGEEDIYYMEDFTINYPNTVTTEIINEFLNVIKENEYKKNEEVIFFIESIYDNLDSYIVRAQ